MKGEDSQMLLSLGSFQFAVDSAAYDQLTIKAEYPWSKADRLGSTPQLQAVGKEHRSISISGTVFPTYNNVGADQVESIRELAAKMEPQILVAGDGKNLGKWCVLSISEDDSCFFEQGTPRKQSYTLELERYSNE